MGWQHSKDTELSVAGDDISGWTNTSEMTRGAGTSNVTHYGSDDEEHAGTLRNGQFTCGGTYDNAAATGPGAVLDPLVGQTVEIVRKAEGTGTGRPQQTFDAVLEQYVETAPVADYVTWSAQFKVSGPVVKTNQA